MTNHTSGKDKDCEHVNKEYKGECFTCNAIADDISPEARKNLKAYVDKFAKSEPPINTIEGIEALFKDYKIHHKDIDACFNDAIAVTHLITSIINLVDKELPLRVEDAINDSRVPYIGGWSEGYNQAIDDMRNKLKEK